MKLFIKRNDLVEAKLKQIQTQIFEIPELASQNIKPSAHRNELLEYRKYVTTLLSASIYLLKAKESKKVKLFSKEDPIYQAVLKYTYQRLDHFYKTYILNDRMIIGESDNGWLKDYRAWGLHLVSMTQKYEEELVEAINTGNPYFFEQFEEKEFVEEYDLELTGQKYYFEHLISLFFVELQKVEGDGLRIKILDLWEVDDKVFDLLPNFVKSVITIQSNISIV